MTQPRRRFAPLLVLVAGLSALVLDLAASSRQDNNESLRDQVDAERVIDGWVGVVRETMQPAWFAVWVREGNS